MRESRRSTSTSHRRGASSTSKPKSKSSLYHRGSEGRERIDTELQKAKEARNSNQPFRFYCGVGDTKSFAIVDESPDFFLYEHNLKDPRTGIWGYTVPCIKEHDNCPVCEEHGESYYAMFLTIIDFTPFTTKKKVEVPFSRKLLVVKTAQQKKFMRRYDKHKSLRGVIFEVSRDSKKEAAIGGDIEYVETLEEEDLLEYERSWEDSDGKIHVEKCHEPIDYESIYEEPTRERLEALVGGAPTPGSRRQVEEDMGEEEESDDGWEEEEAKGNMEEEEEEKPTRAMSRRKRR